MYNNLWIGNLGATFRSTGIDHEGLWISSQEVCRRQDIIVGFKRTSNIFRFLIEPFGGSVEDRFESDKIGDRDMSYDLLQQDKYQSSSVKPKEDWQDREWSRSEEVRGDEIDRLRDSLGLSPQAETGELLGLWGWFRFTKELQKEDQDGLFLLLFLFLFILLVCSESERRGKMISLVMSSSWSKMCIFGDDFQNI